MVTGDRPPGAAVLGAPPKVSKTAGFLRTIGFLAALAIGIAGCATNPVTGKREFSLVSPEQELQMGAEGHKAVLQEYGAYSDSALAAYVDSVGHSLAKVSHLPNLDWHFTVLDDPTVNAFALPGGYIYITRGILAHLNSEAQLAGVLGHEIGHVTARHSARQATEQQIAGLGLTVASAFSMQFRRYSAAAQQALGLMFLKYSRDNETEADALGVQYATKAGWDPREIPATYHMLQRVGERSGQRLPSYLSTHPDPGKRETTTHDLAQQAVAGRTGLVIHSATYVRRLEGVIYGTNPRQGFFEADHFYVPDVDVEIQFPTGWKHQNSRTAVVASEPNDKAAMQLTLANLGGVTPTQYVGKLQADGKIVTAQGRDETIDGSPAWAGRVVVANSDGSQHPLIAVVVARSGTRAFQILGQTAAVGDENEGAIFASARSLRRITDPARRSPVTAKIHLVSITETGTFAEAVAKLGPQAIDADETSILNNIDQGESVLRGQTLKIVRK